MIALILYIVTLIFIGKSFYSLAMDYNHSQWGYTILSSITFIVGSFIGVVILFIISTITDLYFMNRLPDMVINLLSIPLGSMFCWIFYRILLNNWEEKALQKSYQTSIKV
jgi:hypothetical protein